MTNGHNANCETAQRHVCKCGGCGGSQHGTGWLDLVARPDDQERRRSQYEAKLTYAKPGVLRDNMTNREAVVDLARVDIAGSLGETSSSGTAHADEVNTSDFARVQFCSKVLARMAWREIDEALGHGSDAKEVKRQLASHFWCDLFVALSRVVDSGTQVLAAIPDAAKTSVRGAILGSSMQSTRALVTEAVAGLAIDKAWQVFGAALLPAGIRGKDMVRALQMLAVFTCPAPARHSEVREFALKPLGGEVEREVLTGTTKEHLAQLFEELR